MCITEIDFQRLFLTLDELERDRKKTLKNLFKKLYCQTLWHQISLLGYYTQFPDFFVWKKVSWIYFTLASLKNKKKNHFCCVEKLCESFAL